jgi:hypothetical protein
LNGAGGMRGTKAGVLAGAIPEQRWITRGRQALWGGAAAGLVGGFALILFTFVQDLVWGRNLWVGLKLPAYPFLRDRVMTPGFDPEAVAQGLISHLAMSLVWGALFGLAAYGMSRSATVWFGVIWGIVVWIVTFYVVLPLATASVIFRGLPTLLAVGQHILFGLVVGLHFLRHQKTISLWGPVWTQPIQLRAAR